MTQLPTRQLPTSWIGSTLNGRYHIESLLGQGGMSTVYRATDPNLQRTVAVKIIHPHLTDDPQLVQRFEQEATAVARLHHPNIVQVHDFNHHEGVYYMVLEYIPGETLAEKLQALNEMQAHMLPIQSVRITADLCLAVDYAHQRGMVHRDLKPANVMINRLGEPVLMDFGIAKLLGSALESMKGNTFGSARYMSPEQVQGKDIDHRSDIYALGVILFELVSGGPPFLGDSNAEIMSKHVHQALPEISTRSDTPIPAALTAVITTALAKDPAHRYQSAAEMATALHTIGLQLQETLEPLGARHWQHLSRLMQQAQTAVETKDFTGALEKLDELERTGAEFHPEKAAHLRQIAQSSLYEQAVQHFQAGRFDESLVLINLLRPFTPDWPNLAHLETQIRQAQKNQAQQSRLDALYDEAVELLEQGDYGAALSAWQTLAEQRGDLAYADRFDVAQSARDGLCADRYAAAITAVSAAQPEEALSLWAQIQAIQPHYPDSANIVRQANDLLRQRRQRSVWQRRLIVLAPILLLLLVLAVAWSIRSRQNAAVAGPLPTLTAVSAPIALPSATPTPTPTAAPTATPTAGPTATPATLSTPTAVPIQPPTAVPPTGTAPNIALVTEDASIFAAPQSDSLELAVVAPGDEVQILGRSETPNWLFVGNGDVAGFIFQPLVQWEGDVASLPVFTYTDAAPDANATPGSNGGNPVTGLRLDLWPLPDTVQCSSGKWSQRVYMQGQGGNGRYRYYWQDQFLTGPTGASHTFTVTSTGGAIVGTGRVVSEDGQSVERGLFIPIPKCP